MTQPCGPALLLHMTTTHKRLILLMRVQVMHADSSMQTACTAIPSCIAAAECCGKVTVPVRLLLIVTTK